MKYDAKTRRRALRLYKKGRGYKRVASIIGCVPATIRQWVIAGPDVELHPKPDYSKELRKKVVGYYQSHPQLSMDKIARSHGIHPGTLARWLCDAGITPRPYKPAIIGRVGILKDLKAGMRKRDIARKRGCSESWVYRVQSGG